MFFVHSFVLVANIFIYNNKQTSYSSKIFANLRFVGLKCFTALALQSSVLSHFLLVDFLSPPKRGSWRKTASDSTSYPSTGHVDSIVYIILNVLNLLSPHIFSFTSRKSINSKFQYVRNVSCIVRSSAPQRARERDIEMKTIKSELILRWSWRKKKSYSISIYKFSNSLCFRFPSSFWMQMHTSSRESAKEKNNSVKINMLKTHFCCEGGKKSNQCVLEINQKKRRKDDQLVQIYVYKFW